MTSRHGKGKGQENFKTSAFNHSAHPTEEKATLIGLAPMPLCRISLLFHHSNSRKFFRRINEALDGCLSER